MQSRTCRSRLLLARSWYFSGLMPVVLPTVAGVVTFVRLIYGVAGHGKGSKRLAGSVATRLRKTGKRGRCIRRHEVHPSGGYSKGKSI